MKPKVIMSEEQADKILHKMFKRVGFSSVDIAKDRKYQVDAWNIVLDDYYLFGDKHYNMLKIMSKHKPTKRKVLRYLLSNKSSIVSDNHPEDGAVRMSDSLESLMIEMELET